MLILRKESFEQIVKQCIIKLPDEACGILSGKAGKVDNVYEMLNTDKSPQSFFMDPAEQLRINKEIRKLGQEMVGIYHSHVASLAYPSERDVEMAFYPEASYLIISLKDKDRPSAGSFKIQDGKIIEEELKIVP